ncbi:glucose-inactivated glycerol proton symporter STL1 [Sugiyamaella lignohabitans]|uniref:Glucose-inactivated glycerol proton symporter STL1 n=1 Tax=Sugiyamaella lignohabitans TaxID=796027 RepID=A0A167BZ27_9ASCO|nr:glucose-inactivated glycerol proton symporter STL1 [Sugiyamaella lignohabitans]ANB11002.1 glucose-inactivated glycerol proton symporter STL1 [Sugiyamaella lignohabitans]
MFAIPWFDSNPEGFFKLKGSRLIWATAILSSLGFSMIGYGNALMGGIINEEPFKQRFDYPSSSEIGFITAIYGVGAFVGSILTSLVGDSFGRRKSIAIGAIVMILGSLVQSSAITLRSLSVGRFVSGTGLGFLNSTIPVLQNEVSPHGERGMYVAVYCTTLNVGILVAYWVNFSLRNLGSDKSWRLPILLQIFILAPILALTVLTCESPRWLLLKDRDSNALQVLANLENSEPDDPLVEDKFHSLKESVVWDTVDAEQSSFWQDFYNPNDIIATKRLWISLSVQIFQQLGGINVLIYYCPILFEDSIKLSSQTSSQLSVLLQIWLVVTSMVPWSLLDRVGRRPLILGGISGQGASMLMQAIFIYQLNIHGNSNDSEKSSLSIWAILSIVTLFTFEASFAIGMQASVWVYCSEILPLRLRGRGTSLATSANWATNSVLVHLAPVVLEKLNYASFLILAALNFTFLPVAYLAFCETKGLSLEQVDQLFLEHQD